MARESSDSPRQLPERPNLRYLKDQAKGLLKAGRAASVSEAQRTVARFYGFANWPKLKAYIEAHGAMNEIAALKQAIDSNDLVGVKLLMTRNPALHHAPIGYNKNGPLTWVAECRVPWEAPSAVRLAMAQWMIDHGSDLHQGGDGPLMRAALVADRIPMMELLVRNGANVNAEWNGHFPIIFAPCETVQPRALQWLLEHGADPNCSKPGRKHPETALDYVIGTYSRSAELGECIDLLMNAGCTTKRDLPAVLELLRGRLDRFVEHLDRDASLMSRRFGELDFGNTAYRRMLLRESTLLHVAAEYGNVEAARILLEKGADINARAELDEAGVGGQTAVFHAASQLYDYGLPVLEFLVQRGADLSIRAKLPGHYERPDELVECTALGYAEMFPGGPSKTISLLRSLGAPS